MFEARQKLSSINRANKRPVQSEELIKFSHRISASHAISAPLTWQQGDLRRPYPTDIEMRLGFLGKSDLNINGHSQQTQNILNDGHRNSSGEYMIINRIAEYCIFNVYVTDVPASAQNQFAWHPSGELHMSMVAGGSVSLDTRLIYIICRVLYMYSVRITSETFLDSILYLDLSLFFFHQNTQRYISR